MCWGVVVLGRGRAGAWSCWGVVVLGRGRAVVRSCWGVVVLGCGLAGVGSCWGRVVLGCGRAGVWSCWGGVVLGWGRAGVWSCWGVVVLGYGRARVGSCISLETSCQNSRKSYKNKGISRDIIEIPSRGALFRVAVGSAKQAFRSRHPRQTLRSKRFARDILNTRKSGPHPVIYRSGFQKQAFRSRHPQILIRRPPSTSIFIREKIRRPPSSWHRGIRFTN